MYARDHHPPHFHALLAEHEELIVISDLSTYSGSLPKKSRKKVVDWAKDNKDFLSATWAAINKQRV
jgi:hypothetical protein